MRRLEAENVRLREQLDRNAAIYREQLYELVELRTQLDLVRDAVGNGDAALETEMRTS